MSTNLIRAMRYMRAAHTDFRARVNANDPNVTAFAVARRRAPNILPLQQITEYEAMLEQHGSALSSCQQAHLLDLVGVWSQPGAKVVCLNDDVEEFASAARVLMEPVKRSFLAARYSKPSSFEMFRNRTNGCK
jgi:hypothetical protein